MIYRPYLADPRPENMPILSDLHQALLDQHIPEADRVAQALDLYVSGSLNVFNHRTNVDIESRIVAFDIKELGKQLKKIGMLIVQDQIWGRVTQNRSQGKATWFFCDEFHLLLREEQTAAFSCEIWKRFRKWGGIPQVPRKTSRICCCRRRLKIFWKIRTSSACSTRRPATGTSLRSD